MPKISVVVPVYNSEKYIKKCVESLLNQTYNDLEVILVDDGSTDKSEEILNSYIESYRDKVKFYKKEHSGLSDTRNYGVEKTTGTYICFVDSDDYVDINLFETLKEDMENNVDIIKYKLKTVNSSYIEQEKISGPIFKEIDRTNCF